MEFCKECVSKTIAQFGGIDILINNATHNSLLMISLIWKRKISEVGMILLTKEVFLY
ncbi:hypothetical protein [Chryseobacterium sp. 18068]|uniref:hypothetical protein n=1 Tax=Chryseobacterium sp. 18068 TaxID=2681414 RepID=UPI003977A229